MLIVDQTTSRLVRSLVAGLVLGALGAGCAQVTAPAPDGGNMDGGDAGVVRRPPSDGSSPTDGSSPSDGDGDGAALPPIDLGPPCTTSCAVAPTGSDNGPGSTDSPFLTIGHCAAAVHAAGGGECTVSAGTYAETVKVYSATTIHPRTVAGQPDVVTVTGADTLGALAWQNPSPHVWRAVVDLDTGASRLAADDVQLFIDGAPLVEARWPNIDSFENLLDTAGPGESVTQAGTSMADGVHGHIVDAHLPMGANLVGAVVHVRGGLVWTSHTGVITAAGAGTLDYTTDGAGAGIDTALRVAPNNRYFVTNAPMLLDHSGEFHYDHSTKTLSVWLDNGSPMTHTVAAKMREWAFVLDGATGSTLSGFKIFAAAVSMDSMSSGNVLAGLAVLYVSHFVRSVAGPYNGYYNQTGIRLWGANETLRDSTIQYSAGNGVSLAGNGHTVSNNVIAFIDYAGVYNSPIFVTPGAQGGTFNQQILHNTLRTTGRDAIVYTWAATDGDAWKPGAFQQSRIAFNDISDYGRLATDLGGIYMCCGIDGAAWQNGKVVSRSSVDHNRVHDGPGAGIYFDNGDHGFVVAHNVLWGNVAGGVQLNGFAPSGANGSNYDFTINNNTFFTGQQVSIKTNAEGVGGLSQTFISNNIFVTPPQARTGCNSGICAGKGDAGSGGNDNFYGNPGFVNSSVPPYDLHLFDPAHNACNGVATPIWTDTSPVFDTCPTGMACNLPVKPSYGAYNDGGYDW